MGNVATSKLVIDSDVVIDFLRRKSDTLLTALTRFHTHLTAVTVYELEVTAIKSERQVQHFEKILQWVTVLTLDSAAPSYPAW